jgi:hypothetical protein
MRIRTTYASELRRPTQRFLTILRLRSGLKAHRNDRLPRCYPESFDGMSLTTPVFRTEEPLVRMYTK